MSGPFGGLGRPTQNFLPPGYPQYKKITDFTFDLAKAKQLVQQSGTAGQTVDVYGTNEEPAKGSIEYLAGQLTKIGYKPKLHLLSHGVYFQTIGNQATKAQAGHTDWYQDYPHPIDWFDTLLNGNRITETHNNNVGNVNVKSVNAEIEALKKITDSHPGGERSLGEGRPGSHGHVRDDGAVPEQVEHRLLQYQDGHELLHVQRRPVLGLGR